MYTFRKNTNVDVVWGDHGVKFYAAKRKNRPDKFEFVRTFIESHGIQHVLEIGGGDGYVSRFVSGRYINVEGNQLIVNQVLRANLYPRAKFICADWFEIDIQEFVGKFDVVLALAVVEHCPGYRFFIWKMLHVQPKFCIVSFFNRLRAGPDDTIRRQECAGIKYQNVYSRSKFEKWMADFSNDWAWRIDDSTGQTMVVIKAKNAN